MAASPRRGDVDHGRGARSVIGGRSTDDPREGKYYHKTDTDISTVPVFRTIAPLESSIVIKLILIGSKSLSAMGRE
ncbi:hypothetical protein LC1Hm_3286 [Halomicrobium sp. LC1Hm]|nr:hypothetical protein LC1Hm_3286 [Halomicrobium sp. LC1Hm]